jgi:excinuclease ABC subunit C
LQSELTAIKGIGETTAQMLLKKYKSIEAIGNADLDDLSAVIGTAKGKIVRDHFHS